MQANTFWLKFGGLSLAVTLKIRSRSPKPIQLFTMSKYYIHANLVKICHLLHKILSIAPFGSNLAVLSPAVTLKNRSRSPKPNQHFIMSQCYIHANLVELCQPVHEIWCIQALFGLNLASHSDLENWVKVTQPNQLFIISLCYIYANLVKIHPPVHEILCIQGSVTLTQTITGSAPKNNMSPSPLVGDIIRSIYTMKI